MKRLFIGIIGLSVISAISFAVYKGVTNDGAAAQKERLYQRFLKEMQEDMEKLQQLEPSNAAYLSITNAKAQASYRMIFESVIVDPSFGLRWDEVPAPTLAGSNAMAGVDSFVATNGWNMETNDCIFDCISRDDKSKPIRGLPWTVIKKREFSAVTHSNILYVFFKGFHHDGHGVAYNPQTNQFSSAIDSFKPIGQHWYVWVYDHEFPPTTPQPRIYEGGTPSQMVAPTAK